MFAFANHSLLFFSGTRGIAPIRDEVFSCLLSSVLCLSGCVCYLGLLSEVSRVTAFSHAASNKLIHFENVIFLSFIRFLFSISAVRSSLIRGLPPKSFRYSSLLYTTFFRAIVLTPWFNYPSLRYNFSVARTRTVVVIAYKLKRSGLR